jgi:hypothetical protein
MSVTDQLTTRDRQLASWVADQGFQTPFLLVAALRKVDGLKPQTALALMTVETGRARNVFGCDWGSTSSPPWCGQNVTEARYKALRRHGKPNGVGPGQLTSFGFCDRADARGGCWKPFPNMWTSFEILDRLIDKTGSVRAGANRYNGGDSDQGERNGAAAGYGDKFMRARAEWEQKLLRAGFKVA